MNLATAPQSSTLYDIIPPPRAPLTPSLVFWLLAITFAIIFSILMSSKRKHRAPTISSLLTDLRIELKNADNNFISRNAPRISRLLRRAGSEIYNRDLTSFSASELESILTEQDDEDVLQVSPPGRDLIHLLICLEDLKYGGGKLPLTQDETSLIRFLEQIVISLSQSRRTP